MSDGLEIIAHTKWMFWILELTFIFIKKTARWNRFVFFKQEFVDSGNVMSRIPKSNLSH